MSDNKGKLLGKTLNELKAVAKELGMPAFTGTQLANWLYVRHVGSIAEMTNISKANRERLEEAYEIGCSKPIDAQYSTDGTIKYLFPTENGKFVETVYIPDGDRATLCVSCQVGCKMNCLFCQTGKQGFEGNLSATDILNQIYALPERDKLTNIVFMGQGEPMDNLDNVLRATEILTASYGFAWSPRRITVSSVGIRGKLKRFLDESECHVAISLHSPIPEQRAQLMPAEKGMSIKEITDLLRQYDFSHQRRLSFEYIVFDGLNDSMTHAREIVKLLDGLDCRINLIRFHKIPNVDLHTTDEKKMENLRDYLTHHGIFTTIRASRGQDIFAACGLLSTAKKMMMTLLLVILFAACGQSSTLLPKSSGKPYETFVINDQDSCVYNVLSTTVEGLPQAEPSFDVRLLKAADQSKYAQYARSIVHVQIDSAAYPTPSFQFKKDISASPQIQVWLNAPSQTTFKRVMKVYGPQLLSLLTRFEMNAEIARLQSKHNPTAENTARQMLDARISIPADMQSSYKSTDFIWLSDNANTGMQNICIFKGDNIDSMLHANIKGETDDAFMRIADNRMTSTKEKEGERLIRRGTWEMEGDAMGGPFVSHTLTDKSGKPTVTALAFVYAPEMKKRNLMRQVEASLYTLLYIY